MDLRTPGAPTNNGCDLVARGHVGHWIQGKLAVRDPRGIWAWVLAVHDEGFDVHCADGSVVQLNCHDMVSCGDELLTREQIWLQREAGLAWVGGGGISVAAGPGRRPCRLRPVPPARPAVRLGPEVDGVRAATDCIREGHGHHASAMSHARLHALRRQLLPVEVSVDETVVLLVSSGRPVRSCWHHDPARLEGLLSQGDLCYWDEDSGLLGLPGRFGLLPVSLLPGPGPGRACRGEDQELLLPSVDERLPHD